MGEQLGGRTFTREDRQRYRDKVHRCLDVFARMLEESRFDFETPLTGMEVELNLVDGQGHPALRNAEVLARIDDPAFVQELGRFNLEINVPPASLSGGGAAAYEEHLRTQLNAANEHAHEADAGMVMIGILLALQVNNWNEDRKDRILETKYLNSLKLDLQVDLVNLEDMIGDRNRKISSAIALLKYTPPTDTHGLIKLNNMI